MQGPFERRRAFTYNTLKFYAGYYINAQIIYSTWNGELEKNERENLLGIGISLVEIDKPLFPGNANIEYQLASMEAGLNVIKGDINWVLRTRSDQRMYDLHGLDRILDLSKHDGCRMTALSFNSFRNRHFSISDMWLLSSVENMRKYWKVDNAENVLSSFIDHSLDGIPEQILFYNYVHQNLKQEAFNYHNYFEYVTRFYRIVDCQELDFFWFKYEYQKEFRHRNYSAKGLKEFTQSFWELLRLRNGNTN